jgi:hypothetical protein
LHFTATDHDKANIFIFIKPDVTFDALKAHPLEVELTNAAQLRVRVKQNCAAAGGAGSGRALRYKCYLLVFNNRNQIY